MLGNIIVSFAALSIRMFLMQNWAIFLRWTVHAYYVCMLYR